MMMDHLDQIHAVLLTRPSNQSDGKPNFPPTAEDNEVANGPPAYVGRHLLSLRSPRASLRFHLGAWALRRHLKAKEMKSKNTPRSNSLVLLYLRIEELDAFHSN